jgi:hypothetical protein
MSLQLARAGDSSMEVVKHISSHAEQMISEYQLGHARAEYKENLLKTGLILIALLPVSILALAIFLPALVSPSFTFSGDWLHTFEQWGNMLPALMWGSCFLLVGIIGTILFVITLWRGEKKIYLGEKGFIAVRRQVEVAARWETVQEIRSRILLTKGKSNARQQFSSYTHYTIVPAEGKRCSIVGDPGPTIEEAVTACLLPRAIENYEAEKSLSFGWLTLHKQGIYLTLDQAAEQEAPALAKLPGVARTLQKVQGTSISSGEQVLAWAELALFWIDESSSTLIISKRNEREHWAIVPLHQVPNAALCQILVERALFGNTHESV